MKDCDYEHEEAFARADRNKRIKIAVGIGTVLVFAAYCVYEGYRASEINSVPPAIQKVERVGLGNLERELYSG